MESGNEDGPTQEIKSDPQDTRDADSKVALVTAENVTLRNFNATDCVSFHYHIRWRYGKDFEGSLHKDGEG